MEIFKTMAFMGDETYLIDTIWHEENWWLVATWLEHHATKQRIPEKIIQLDGRKIRFQEVHEQNYRFLVNSLLSTSFFDDAPQNKYVVSTHPAAVYETQGPKSIQ